MACGSCGQRANAAAVVAYRVVGTDGLQIGEDFATRVDAERERLKSPGATVRPVTNAERTARPGPATNSAAKRRA